MPWLEFGTFPLIVNVVTFTAAGVIVWSAGVRLSTYANALNARTRLSQAFLGIALLGVATSLAELATTMTAAYIGNADLVSGNLFGGVAMQITVLAIVDLMVVRGALTCFAPSAVLLFQGAMLLLMLSVALAGGAIGEPFVVRDWHHLRAAGRRIFGYVAYLNGRHVPAALASFRSNRAHKQI